MRSRRCLLKPLTYILHHTVIQPGNGWAAALPTQTGPRCGVLSVAPQPSHLLCLPGPHTHQAGGGHLHCDTLQRTAGWADSFAVASLRPGSALNIHAPLPRYLRSTGQKTSCFSSSVQKQAGAVTKGCGLGLEYGRISKLAWRRT